MKKILYLLSICLTFNVYSSDLDLKLNINGAVKSSTCSIEINKNVLFDFGDILSKANSSGLGSGIGSRSEWSDGKKIDFNCPSNLLLRGQLVGSVHPASESYIMSTDRSITGFAFILGYAYPDDDKNKIALFSFNSKVNLLNPSNQEDTTVRTKAGINTVYLYAQIAQISEKYNKGLLNSTVTLNISYQ